VYTLDTNAIIYYLKDEAAAVKTLTKIFSEDAPLYISAITEVELFGFPNLADAESDQITELLRTIAVIPLDSQIARTAAEIRRSYRCSIADSVIAATALFTGTKLLTRNIADFKKIAGLEVQTI
jgi:predicted nucleic acid-binding protein